MNFAEFIRLDEALPMGGMGGGSPMGNRGMGAPMGGGMGALPPPGPPPGGGFGGPGLPPPGGALGGALGGPPMGGGGMPMQQQQQQDTSIKVKTKDVWQLLEKLLSGKEKSDNSNKGFDKKPDDTNNLLRT